MARPLRPLISSGGYYPSRRWIPLVRGNGYTTQDGGEEEPGIWKTIKGALIHLTDALASPMQKCEVTLEPIQDLHGQDAPYPAGGGKNKIDQSAYDSLSGLTFANGVFSGTQERPFSGIYFCRTRLGTSRIQTTWLTYDSTSGRYVGSISVDLSAIDTFVFGVSGYNNNCEALFTASDVFPGSGTYYFSYKVITPVPSEGGNFAFTDVQVCAEEDYVYHPYSNICPITGWTGCEVKRTGKNLFDKDNVNILDNVYLAYGNKELKGGGGNRGFILPCKGEQSYTLSLVNKNATDLAIASFTELPAVGIIATAYGSAQSGDTYKTATVTTGTNDKYLFIKYNNVNVAQTYTNDEIIAGIQIELGETASEYEPYNGTTLSVTFPDSVGTVYGGTVDLVTGDGEITQVKWIENGSRQPYIAVWTQGDDYNSTLFNSFSAASGLRQADYTGKQDKFICNNRRFVGINGVDKTLANTFSSYKAAGSYSFCYSIPKTLTTKAEIAAWFAENPSEVVYLLGNPIPFHVDPQQISTLAGENNVWGDGNIEMTYKAQAE